MFVALATPDSPLASGEVQTRQNIILEIGAALERPHLKDRVLVFRAPKVELPSNFNPVYQPLDPENVSASFSDFEEQARTWQLLDSAPEENAPAQPSSPDAERLKGQISSPYPRPRRRRHFRTYRVFSPELRSRRMSRRSQGRSWQPPQHWG